MKILKLSEIEQSEILNRAIVAYPEYEQKVRAIIADVEARGDEALRDYAKQFDGVVLDELLVTEAEFEEAFQQVSPEYIAILEQARDNIIAFHERQKRDGFVIKKENGIVLGQKVTPIEKAGLYVPGGTAPLTSTVLMNAIPAKIAGVKQIVMATPPAKNGKIKAEMLVAASLCGVKTVVKSGGAQAIAALANGTESVPKVDKITGPGNIFVALAKKEVFGMVGIEMIAGPSEILVVADDSASPSHVAADLLSQAEHDRLASAVLVTDSLSLAEGVQTELAEQLAKLPRSEIAGASLDANGKIILVDSLEEAIETANLIAPEHLELAVADPFKWLDKVQNAGSIFMGRYAPEPLGDYFAGPNHTLPTGGSARFSSPLSVDDFVKKTQYIYYPEDQLNAIYKDVAAFARSEGLDAHARAMEVRFEGEGDQ
ncbi:MAG: histidinol dehydrogenase [Eubacteriales bacterium]